MKKVLISLFIVQLLTSHFFIFPPLRATTRNVNIMNPLMVNDLRMDVKQEAFNILKAKCNVCHRRQNPFKIFSLKNMDKNAPRIHQQVFIKRRMPKGDKIKLSDQEYQTLNQWLISINIP